MDKEKRRERFERKRSHKKQDKFRHNPVIENSEFDNSVKSSTQEEQENK